MRRDTCLVSTGVSCLTLATLVASCALVSILLISPTVSKPELATEQTLGSIQLMASHILRCRATPTSDTPVELFVGAWIVRLNARDNYVRRGIASIRLESKDGTPIWEGRTTFFLMPDQDNLILPNNLASDSLGLGYERQPHVEKIKIDFDSSLVWNSIDHSLDNVHLDLKLIEHIVSVGQYPTHTLTVEITNPSPERTRSLTVAALIYDSQGNLVDILATTQSNTDLNLGPRSSQQGVVPSLSRTGRCTGQSDPAGYVADVWIAYEIPRNINESGPLKVDHFRFDKLPH